MSNIVTLDAVRAASLALFRSGVALESAEIKVADRFRASAVATSTARQDGHTLAAIVAANVDVLGDNVHRAYRGTTYTSVQAVNYHALTGDVLRMVDGADVDPYVTQDTVNDCLRTQGVGTKIVKRALKLDSASAALAFMTDAVKAAKDAAKITAGSDDTDGDTDGDTGTDVPVGEVQTVESLLGRALAMLADGSDVSDGVRAMVSDLVKITGPVAVPAAA